MLGVSSIRGWSVAACLSLLLSTGVAHADEKISEDAKLYFQNGVELIQNQPPNYQDAYYQFKLAWDKSHSWKVLGNWGLCALKLERDGEAIWAYTEYLKKGGADVDAGERKDLERDLLLLNGNAATVNVTSSVSNLDVVDTRAGSSAPPQSYKADAGKLSLRLRAGTHALSATSQGKTLRWDIALSPGDTAAHGFDFSEAKAATAAAAPVAVAVAPAPAPSAAQPGQPPPTTPPETTPSESGGTLRVVGYVAAGVGVLALGGGALFGSLAKSQESDARAQCLAVDSGLDCRDSARSKFSDAQGKASLANILLIGGGVVTAAGVGMIVWGGPSHSEQGSTARVRVSPLLNLRALGLFAQGAF